MNPYIAVYIFSLFPSGCGGGILCEAMARQGYDVTGIDPCKESIAIAIQHAEKGALAIDYRALEVDEYVNLHGHSSYDVITLMEVIEHVSDFPYLINNLSKLLHCGGYIFISSLNRTLKSMFLLLL